MGKRKTQKPNYDFMDLDTFKKSVLNKKERNERESILKYLNCNPNLIVKQIRFGDPKSTIDGNSGEPDFIIKTSNKIIGIEITDAVKESEAKFLYQSGDKLKLPESTLNDLIQLLKTRVKSKYSKNYTGVDELDEFVLLVIEKINKNIEINSYTPFSLFPEGTPKGHITSIQREMKIAEVPNRAGFNRSCILVSRKNNKHLLVHFNVEQS